MHDRDDDFDFDWRTAGMVAPPGLGRGRDRISVEVIEARVASLARRLPPQLLELVARAVLTDQAGDDDEEAVEAEPPPTVARRGRAKSPASADDRLPKVYKVSKGRRRRWLAGS